MRKKHKILVVDGEEGIRQVLVDLLAENNFEVIEASNGKEASHIVTIERPDLIISDAKMPLMSGIELLHFCKREFPAKFILMTGFSDYLEMQEALELGASAFIAKPFNFDEFINQVNQCLEISKVKKSETPDELFTPLDLDYFVCGKAIPCAIFIKLKSDHYIKLANKNDPIPTESIQNYRVKGIKVLYVLTDEYAEFLGFNLKVLSALSKNDKIAKEKVSSFLSYTNDLVLKNAFLNSFDRSTVETISQYAGQSMQMICHQNLFFHLLEDLKNHHDRIYAHCLATAITAIMIAKKAGITQEPTLFKIFMAGLMHDIGLREVPRDIIEKNPALRSDEENKILEQHTTRGMEILNQIGSVPEEVILAAYQHHEDLLGHGYPLALRRSKISPISRLIAVAEIVDDRMSHRGEVSLNSYRNAFNQIDKFKRDHYDRQFFEAFRQLLFLN